MPSAPITTASPPRRILLAVIGMSPQIVTESLYALATRKEQPWVPDEVHVISTTRGAENARLNLLSGQPGWFQRLRRDYGLPEIAFPESNIHIIQRPDGSLLDDIRDDADNELAADYICERVRALTTEAHSELHASIAGGRKTMGFFLGYAMSLYGRPQDRLSHVLVSEQFETLPEFYYPSPEPRVIHNRSGQALDCQSARVWLGDIPFVRLREKLPEDLIEGKASYSQAVAEVQKNLPPVISVVLRPRNQELLLGGESVRLEPSQYAFYWVFAERARRGQPGLHWSDRELVNELLACTARLCNSNSGDYERTEKAYRSNYDGDNFSPTLSKIRKAIRKALGQSGKIYELTKTGRKDKSNYHRFGLALPPEVIHIEN